MIFRRKKAAEEPVVSDSETPVDSPDPSMNGSGSDIVHAEGLRPPDDGPASVSRTTRKRLPLWDRVKYLILLTLLWFLLVWAAMGDDPLLPFGDACRETARNASWVFVLAGIELLRQVHFLVSERWSRYHHFW